MMGTRAEDKRRARGRERGQGQVREEGMGNDPDVIHVCSSPSECTCRVCPANNHQLRSLHRQLSRTSREAGGCGPGRPRAGAFLPGIQVPCSYRSSYREEAGEEETGEKPSCSWTALSLVLITARGQRLHPTCGPENLRV